MKFAAKSVESRFVKLLVAAFLQTGLFAQSGTLVVLNKTDNTASQIDCETRTTRSTIHTGVGPHEVSVSPDGKLAVERSKMLLVVNIESGRVEQAIPTEQEVSDMVVLTPDNHRAFVANIGSGSVTVIDLKSGSRVTSVKTGDEGIDISPDGKEVWITNRAANSVTVVQTQDVSVSATLMSKDFPIRTKFTPDGKYTLVSIPAREK